MRSYPASGPVPEADEPDLRLSSTPDILDVSFSRATHSSGNNDRKIVQIVLTN